MANACQRWGIWGLGVVCLLASACDEKPAPAAPSPPPTAPTPAAAPPKPAASAEGLPNPCAKPSAQTIDLEAGVLTTTPWGHELTYAIDEDEKLGPGYMFLLKYGQRRWETRRDNGNWNNSILWRGFCWRGGARPEKRASHVQIMMAPLCKNGALVEMGDCSGVY